MRLSNLLYALLTGASAIDESSLVAHAVSPAASADASEGAGEGAGEDAGEGTVGRELIVARNCMDDNYSGSVGCTANDVEFIKIRSFTVFDKAAFLNPATGHVDGACRGKDDYVTVAFNVDFQVRNARYDVGMYINTEGGSALTGTCTVARLSNGTFGEVVIAEVESTKDKCWDVSNSGMLTNFPFEKVTLACADTPDSTGKKDGLLDFDIAIAWRQTNSDYFCDVDDPLKWPIPGSPSKCWYDPNSRVTLNITVPPYNTPSAVPSRVPSRSPSDEPTVSLHPTVSFKPTIGPSDRPSRSQKPTSEPSDSPSLSSKPSSHPTLSPSVSSEPTSEPSDSPSKSHQPSLSTEPSAAPTAKPSVSSAPSLSSQPTSEPSLAPSESSQPSLSTKPTSEPSGAPSVSSNPTSLPSAMPSTSREPTAEPSDSPSKSSAPSLSTKPSAHPTTKPSVSSAPSLSTAPSSSTDEPSLAPSKSSQPSKSSHPTSLPSSVPSLSTEPSSHPTTVPSLKPSLSTKPTSEPSDSPSKSSAPSISTKPSASPTGAPSLSAEPSSTTESPSLGPSESQSPSISPSASPTKSSAPTFPPSVSPSAAPSAQPTEGYYYPDWIHENQVCTNDGNDPEYMLEVQRNNYLYRSKEDCCRNHFWWRITQCMANENPMFYSDGSKCDQKVFFEDWEHNSPAEWSKTKLFETLDECCIDAFWYDYEGCMGSSPKEMTFFFTIDIEKLVEPTFCQDADTIANAIGVAMNVGLGDDSYADVTNLGSITLSRDSFSGNTICGGSLEGSTFLGDWDGTRGTLPDGTGVVTSVTAKVTTKSNCVDSACIQALFDDTITTLSSFVSTGALTAEIQSWARERLPPVKQLYDVAVTPTSLQYEEATNPYVITADSKVGLEVTTGGSFEVNMDLSSVTTVAQLKAIAAFIESGIQSTLSDSSALPTGATSTVTTICGINLAEAKDPIYCSDTTTSIEYSTTFYLNYDADASGVSNLISDILSEPATMSSLSDAVIGDASSAADVSVIAAINSMTITSFIPADVEIKSLGKYYPDWVDLKTCTNNGRAPPFIRENSIGYMFDTAEECCAVWFKFQTTCGKSAADLTAPKYFPDRQKGQCGLKPLNEFGAGEINSYDTLFECCQAQFPLKLVVCCQAQGMGGCNESGVPKYIADWQLQKCYAKDEIYVQPWENVWKYDTMKGCCDGSFRWSPQQCCSASGGC